MSLMALVETMGVLFIVIAIGYILGKTNILNKKFNEVASDLIVKITSPVLVISSVCGKEINGDKKDVIAILIIGILMYSILILFSKIVMKILHFDIEDSKIYGLMLIFTNTAFIGYPVLRSLYGDYAIFISSILHMPFNILIYSYGIYMIKGEIRDNEERQPILKKIINPGIIASIIALVIFLLEFNVPNIFREVLKMVGDITIPLSMLLIGSSLSLIPLSYVFKDIKVYIISFIKLLVMPTLTYFIVRVFTTNNFYIAQLVIATALPAASMIIILSTQYKSNIKVASAGVFMTTILSVITIPIIVSLLLI